MRCVLAKVLVLSACFAQLSVEGVGGLVVQMDTTDGFFALGDTAGHPLMYNFDYPWLRDGMFILFMVDDSGFTNYYSETFYGYTFLRDYSAGCGYWSGGISKEWDVPYGGGSIFFRLTVTPVEIDGVGVAKITFYVFNGDTAAHDFGAMLQLDILVGSNDRAPLATGTSVLSRCTILEDDEIPYFWQSYEVSPSAGCGQVIARGFLRSLGATPPDRFVLAHYPYIWRQPWELDTTYEGLDYIDSAVLLRWPKQRVSSCKSATFVTYFGFGKCVEESTDVVLLPLVPGEVGAECDTLSLPFEVAALVHNAGLAAGVAAGTLCVTLPAGMDFDADPFHPASPCVPLGSDPLELDSTAVSAWLVNVVDPTLADTTLPIVIDLYAQPDIALSSTSWVYIPSPDGEPPVVDVHFPYRCISCGDSGSVVIPFFVYDSSGIDPLSVSVQVGGRLLTPTSGYVHLGGDTIYVEVPVGMLVHGAVLEYRFASLSDVFGCTAEDFPPPGTLLVDLFPPSFLGFDPPGGSFIGSVPVVRLRFADEPAGVDTASVELQFDGAVVAPDDPRISWEGDSVLVFSSTDTFPPGYPLTICLTHIADRAELCGPNEISLLQCATYTISGVEEAKPEGELAVSVVPNPFNAACDVKLSLSRRTRVSVDVLDTSGRLLVSVFRGVLDGGAHRLRWRPDGMASGVYIVRVCADDAVAVSVVAYVK